jgi:hypothetical protein
MLIYFSNIITNMWKMLRAPDSATLCVILEMPSCSFRIIKFLCDLLLLLLLLLLLFSWDTLKCMRQDQVFFL